MAKLIEGVRLSKHAVKQGEPFLVEVDLADVPDVCARINGVVGARQYLQLFGDPGEREIVVNAGAPRQGSELTTAKIELQPGPSLPRLVARACPHAPYTVALSLGYEEGTVPEQHVYRWRVGDRVISTRWPAVIVDLADDIRGDRPYTSFDVSVWSGKPGTKDGHTVRRTLSVWSGYYLCKRRGVVRPRVRNEAEAERKGPVLEGRFAITNLEAERVAFSSGRVEFLREGQDGGATPGAAKATQVEIPPNGTVEHVQRVKLTDFPRDAIGFAVHLQGKTASGLQARASAYFDVPGRGSYRLTKDAKKFASKLDPSVWRVSAGRRVLRDESLWEREQLARPFAARASQHGKKAAVKVPSELEGVMKHRADGRIWSHLEDELDGFVPLQHDIEPELGAPCDPYDVPDDLEGLACLATGETEVRQRPGRLLNARKGDIVLSPGGTTMIGKLMLQVDPPQRFSHCGIMTKNYTEIRHSTASEEWLANQVGTDGVDPASLRYQWPGTITQTIDEAIKGKSYQAPDGESYAISAFTFHPKGADFGSGFEIQPPLVVKPDVTLETTEIREKLHEVADLARAMTGHYRFYCYTNAQFGQTDAGVAPAVAGWAAGTRATVCSSFVWMAAKAAGVQLEGEAEVVTANELEPEDVQAGAAVNGGAPDGLYTYTEFERLNAGLWLFGYFHDYVREAQAQEATDFGAWWVEGFSDQADDVTNQILNAFASDWTAEDAKDSSAWMNPGPGTAVSPDDMLFWDPPGSGIGLYGSFEELVYRPARYEEVPITTWQHPTGTGALEGSVVFEGNPQQGAVVTVAGLERITDSDGWFSFDALPGGSHPLSAGKLIEAWWMSAATDLTVTVPANDTATVTVELLEPPQVNRAVEITGSIYAKDHEDFTSNEVEQEPIHTIRYLDPDDPHDSAHFELGVGGEVRVELDVNVDLAPGSPVVSALWKARLYEGATEATDELEDSGSGAGVIAEDQSTLFGPIKLYNVGATGDDFGMISFTVANKRQMS